MLTGARIALPGDEGFAWIGYAKHSAPITVPEKVIIAVTAKTTLILILAAPVCFWH